MTRALAALVGLGVIAVACSEGGTEILARDPPYDPPPETCAPASADAPRTFAGCSTGSGIFGRWTVDAFGYPAYDYGLDENADARASFYNTRGEDRRDHWFSFGNDRVTALAYNDGYVELTDQDRGPEYLNKFDAAQQNFAGGFSYVDDGRTTWNTAYEWRPPGAVVTRRYGMGYYETSSTYDDIRVTHVIYAPAGDVTSLVDEVTVANLGSVLAHVKHYEYWDVGRRPLTTNWIVSGNPLSSVPGAVDASRDAEDAMFDESASWDPSQGVLQIHRTLHAGVTAPPPEAASATDDYPGEPFLATLIGPTDAFYTDQRSFFGAGGVASPDAVRAGAPGQDTDTIAAPTPGAGQGRALVLRADLALPPHASQSLRYAYGYVAHGDSLPIQHEWHDPDCDMRKTLREELATHLLYFANAEDGPRERGSGALQREMAWHASQLEASVGYRDYWGHHVVPQGSAYLYLHGADGALRDLALFAVPLVYTDPALARDEIALMTGMQYASDKRFSYAFQGHGVLDDALGLHAHPSDLDIYFLFAVSEYVGATGDLPFLEEVAPYYPKDAVQGAIVYDHVRDAVRHLFDVVGTGEHGLVRIGDGDWNDGIVFEAPDRSLAIDKGESVPNTQMAVAVLPRVADLIEPRDAALAQEIRQKVASYKQALAQTWTGSFFGRAYFGDGKLAHADAPELESQVWALIGGSFPDPADRDVLVARVAKDLDDPSPTGAMLSPGGQVWPAISGLLTWGYALSDEGRAYAHLARNTMTAHALAFPDVWYGIWSGPDGLESAAGDRPGQAWYSAATPMTDFPVMNGNQDAMPLLATLRVAGVDASATGLVIQPHVPGRDFALQTELLDLRVNGASIQGTYRPTREVPRTVEVRAPAGGTVVAATLNGANVDVAPGASAVVLDVPATNGEGASFEVLVK